MARLGAISSSTSVDTTAEVDSKVQGRLTYVTIARSGNADYVCDGTADDVQIQAAINAVATAGGGTIFIRAGMYRIAATIVIPFDAHVRIVGEKFAKTNENNAGTTLKTSASVTLTNMFEMYGKGPGSPTGEGAGAGGDPATNADLSHDIAFENLSINGNLTTTNLFYLSNVDYAKFDYCRLISATNTIMTDWNSSIAPTASTIPGGIYMNNCIVSANSGDGIVLDNQTQCWITNSWFTGTSVTSWIDMLSCNKIHVINCEFNTATQALYLKDTVSASTQDIIVADSVFAGGKAWSDTRTHASSNRVSIVGYTQASGSNDTLVGNASYAIGSNGFRMPGGVFTSDITLPDEIYGSGWNGSLEAPTKNAVYDKIESIIAGGGTGDVTGPASSTDNGIVRFDGTTGKTIQDTSGPAVADDGRITTVTDPTAAQDAATKAFVEATAIAFAVVL